MISSDPPPSRRFVPTRPGRHPSLRGVVPAFLLALAVSVQAEVRAFPDLTYQRIGATELKLDLFVPDVRPNPPLIVYVHGGSWMKGTRKSLSTNLLPWLTGRGFAVASISYRFSDEAKFPAQIEDCKSAVRWLRAHAGDYGFDATRVAALGSSAGGHLVTLLGTTGGSKDLEGTGNPGESSRVQAVVDFYGPTDFILRAKDQPQHTDEPGSKVYNLLGGAPKDNEALAKLASSAWQVSADSAPMLIFHGAQDSLVLPNQSRRLLEAAEACGVEASLHIDPKAGHSMMPFFTDENKERIAGFLDQYLKPQ